MSRLKTRLDAVKRAEQEQIAAKYQSDTDARRQDGDGVVVTPTEIVDFQIRAVIDQLAAKGTTLADPRVRVLDPFGGTGIYLARLIQLAPLTVPEKIDLIARCRMVEIDAHAVEIARENLTDVTAEETGQTAVLPRIIHADTFELGDEVWQL